MILEKHQILQSEIATLEDLISQTPEEDIIDRRSLEARKKKIEAELAALQPPYYEPARGQLIFRGNPVIKSQGIYANFAAPALDKYSKMITYLTSNQTVELSQCGPIPNKDEFQLMITGTLLGSFGFEVEEVPRQTTVSSELSPIRAAMEKANLVMGLSLSSGSSDEDIVEAIGDISTRSIEAIREFLKVMETYDATFSIELDNDKSIGFSNIEQIKQARERLKPENIRESDRDLLGKFQGVLPAGRTFEFLIKEKEYNEIIRGKVGPKIETPSNINLFVGKTMKISVHTRQVGTSRPRYTLNSYEEIG